MKTISRNIDSFMPGQLVMVSFNGKQDDALVAVVIAKKMVGMSFGDIVYDIAILPYHNTGVQGGTVVVIDLPLWRYIVSDDNSVEGTPPQRILDSILQYSIKDHHYFSDYGIRNEQLFYTKNTDDETVGEIVKLF